MALDKYQCFKCGNSYFEGETCNYCYLADSNKKALENLADSIEMSQRRHADEMRNSLIDITIATAVVGAKLKAEEKITIEEAYQAGYRLENLPSDTFESLFHFGGSLDYLDLKEKFKPDYFNKNLQSNYLNGMIDYLNDEFGSETLKRSASKKISKSYFYSDEVWAGFLEDAYKNGYQLNGNFKLISKISLWGRYYIVGTESNFESKAPLVTMGNKTQNYILNVTADSGPFGEVLKSQLRHNFCSKDLWQEYLRGINERIAYENMPNKIQERIEAKSEYTLGQTLLGIYMVSRYLVPILIMSWFYYSDRWSLLILTAITTAITVAFKESLFLISLCLIFIISFFV
jgi:hypothetical protein